MSEELKKGTRIRITLEGRLREDTHTIHPSLYDALYLGDGSKYGVYLENVPVSNVEVFASSLDDYQPGVYVTANNRDNITGAAIIRRRSDGAWRVFGLNRGDMNDSEAEAMVERWIDAFGPLVRLDAKEVE